MIDIKINQEYIETLEYLAERAYAVLSRAFTTLEKQDAIWTKGWYSNLGIFIGILLNEQNFRNCNRESERARLLERYTLPYIIGDSSTSEMLIARPSIEVPRLQDDVIYIEKTKEFIKNPNTTYIQVESVARELVRIP